MRRGGQGRQRSSGRHHQPRNRYGQWTKKDAPLNHPERADTLNGTVRQDTPAPADGQAQNSQALVPQTSPRPRLSYEQPRPSNSNPKPRRKTSLPSELKVIQGQAFPSNGARHTSPGSSDLSITLSSPLPEHRRPGYLLRLQQSKQTNETPTKQPPSSSLDIQPYSPHQSEAGTLVVTDQEAELPEQRPQTPAISSRPSNNQEIRSSSPSPPDVQHDRRTSPGPRTSSPSPLSVQRQILDKILKELPPISPRKSQIPKPPPPQFRLGRDQIKPVPGRRFRPHVLTDLLDMAGSGASGSGTATPATPFYSKSSWKQDAIFVAVLADEMNNGGFPHLEDALTEQDVREAMAITRTMDKKTRLERAEKAKDDLNSLNSSAANVVAFGRFMKRFRDGPTEDEENQDDLVNGEEGQDDRNRRGRFSRQPDRNLTGQGQSKDKGKEKYNDRGGYSRAKNQTRPRRGYPDDDDEGSSSDDHHSSRRSHRSQHKDDNPSGYFGRIKRLRVDELGVFDGTPNTPTAVAYCKRLTFLANSYGEEPVLATLPLCMKDKALAWFSGLDDEVVAIMSESLDEWKTQLVRRFRTNASQALAKADNMEHRFADESNMDVREYITSKQSLYVEAGEKDQDLIVRRIHAGLDPTLAAAVPLRAHNNTMNDFTNKVYSAEHQARAQYQQIQNKFDAQEKQLQSLLEAKKEPTSTSSWGQRQGWTPKFQGYQTYNSNWTPNEAPQQPQFAIPTAAMDNTSRTAANTGYPTGQGKFATTGLGGSQPRLLAAPPMAPAQYDRVYTRPPTQPIQYQQRQALPGNQQYNGYRPRGNWGKNWNNRGDSRSKFDATPQQPVTTLMVDTEFGPQEYSIVDQDTYDSYYQQTCLPVSYDMYYDQTEQDVLQGTPALDPASVTTPPEEGKVKGGS